MALQEKLRIRDHSFSLWHRTLKKDWYMMDTDTTLWSIVDKEAKVIALLEEKHSNIKELDLNSFQFKALRDLAGERPAFALVVNEGSQYKSFYIVAANKAAISFLTSVIGKDRKYLSEADYIKFESYLRKETPPLSVMDKASILYDKFPLPVIKEIK